MRDDLLRLPRGTCLKGGARGLGTGEELRIVDASDIGTLELGEQRAARIGCNRRDRAWTGAQAEPMQGQGGISCGVLTMARPLQVPNFRTRAGRRLRHEVTLQYVAYAPIEWPGSQPAEGPRLILRTQSNPSDRAILDQAYPPFRGTVGEMAM